MSPGECVLLSTSKSVRKALNLGIFFADGCFRRVQLDVRDLGRHLDFTERGLVLCLAESRRLLLVWLLLVHTPKKEHSFLLQKCSTGPIQNAAQDQHQPARQEN